MGIVTEQQKECLSRARNGDSVANYNAIYSGFEAKGIPTHNIKPRENIFTFPAWKANGRHVNKGERGVKVLTWINGKKKDADGEERKFKFKKYTTVFHITQTSTIGK